MWRVLLQQWNGVSLFIETEYTLATQLGIYTATSDTGFGGYFGEAWFSAPWADITNILELSQTFMEIFTFLVAAAVFGRKWGGHRLMFSSNDRDVVWCLTKSRSDHEDIMILLQKLVHLAAIYSFAFSATFSDDSPNNAAVALSHLQWDLFLHLHTAAHGTPHQIPQDCIRLLRGSYKQR